jgi:hypothetical protein
VTRADETAAAARLAYEEASAFLAGLDERPVLPEGVDEAADRFGGPLPEEERARSPRSRSCSAGWTPPPPRRGRASSTS